MLRAPSFSSLPRETLPPSSGLGTGAATTGAVPPSLPHAWRRHSHGADALRDRFGHDLIARQRLVSGRSSRLPRQHQHDRSTWKPVAGSGHIGHSC
ncbi:MAG: hypothetical protein LC808_40085, partial [Actinobacteria bacterium]|nr:hypothetical protein [Actinomycetota bacterium]